jgi:hypothetical protein
MPTTKVRSSDTPHALPGSRYIRSRRRPTARRFRLRLRYGVPAIAGMLLLAACSTAHGAARPSRLPRGAYVALGDSYTAGPDIPDQVGTPAGCQRSSRNYPALVAQYLRLSANQVRDVSCSGARIADLSTPQTTADGTNPAQRAALSAATALVTLGIGGNDVDSR